MESRVSIRSLVAIAFLLAACGGGSDDDKGPGGASASGGASTAGFGGNSTSSGGTSTSSGGNADSGGTGNASCDPPPCLANYGVDCAPEGDCVQGPTDPAMPFNSAQCYANGVKVVSTFDLTTGSFAVTTSKDGAACGSSDFAVTADGNSEFTFKDADGNVVATITADPSGNSTIECDGQTYQYNAADCGTDMSSSGGSTGMPPMCSMGDCAP